MGVSRVFVGPVEIAGVGIGLVRGMREKGVRADLRLKMPHPFSYAETEPDTNLLVRFWQWLGLRVVSAGHPLAGLCWRVLQTVVGFPVLLVFAARYDAFFFIFGRTISGSLIDLWLLRLLGRRVVVIFCGSDTRPTYADGGRRLEGLKEGRLFPKLLLWLLTRLNQRRVAAFERYADYLVNSPATGHFHRKPYINWFSMGIPRSLVAVEKSERAAGDSVDIRILHSPSNPEVKGTAIVRALVKKLKAEGLPLQLIELQGASNQMVLQAIRDCDLVFDQVYSDTPMAALASEAAALGRPALVGGYFAPVCSRYVLPEDMPPTCFVHPDDLEPALRRLVTDAQLRRMLGAAAQQFVQQSWDSAAVAGRYLQLLKDDVPDKWWCQPEDVDYLEGCGLHKSVTADRVRMLVEFAGVRALGLSAQPRLETRFLRFAQAESSRAP